MPTVQGRAFSTQLAELRESGDVISYYETCLTIGAQTENCDGFPKDEAHIIDDNTACFQGLCLQVTNVHAVYLLALWNWPDTTYDLPTTVLAEQTAIRSQYRTLPLNQLSADIDLIGSSTEIAM